MTTKPKPPPYNISIHTSSINQRIPILKQKTQKEYLPKYWKKLSLDQKVLVPPTEDRLSMLTIQQIDRIIDQEKIKELLFCKKAKRPDIYFQCQDKPNTHTNIYKANFLAKINALAIKRNIRHETSNGFDEYFGEQIKSQGKDGNQLIPKGVGAKNFKKYQTNVKKTKKRAKTSIQNEEEKSIESIEDRIDEFQQKLSISKRSEPQLFKKEAPKQRYKLFPNRRWFQGMSTFYIDKANKKQAITQNNKMIRPTGFDIESQMRLLSQSLQRSKSLKETLQSSASKKWTGSAREPFDRYKVRKLVAVG